MSKFENIPAGNFSSWLRLIRQSLKSKDDVDVQCGTCIGCCSSSYFIHIRPEESSTLSHIPKQLLFPAPGQPKGTVLLGYGKDGRCPMLAGDACSIYEYRPLTCRTYDCRIYAATGISVADDKENVIARRVSQWQFSFPAKHDKDEFAAVQASARFLQENASYLPANMISLHPSQMAILAIQAYEVFLEDIYPHDRILSEEMKQEIIRAVSKTINSFRN